MTGLTHTPIIAALQAFALIVPGGAANWVSATALQAAGWDGTSPVEVTVTVPAGAYPYASSASQYALTLSALPAGSKLTFVNLSTVGGVPGAGGGGVGGPAINLLHDATFVNGSGLIAGGGGGGGNGASNPNAGAGGAGGQGQGNSAGTIGGPASGGSGASYFDSESGNTYFSGGGGTGGAWGAAGSAGGGAGTNGYVEIPGSAGGAAGKAVNLNGHTITWVSGNDAAHVKGTVS